MLGAKLMLVEQWTGASWGGYAYSWTLQSGSLRLVRYRRYIEQVAVALHGNDRAVETVQALLRSCRAKTVSSAAAMHQASTTHLDFSFCDQYPYPGVKLSHIPKEAFSTCASQLLPLSTEKSTELGPKPATLV